MYYQFLSDKAICHSFRKIIRALGNVNTIYSLVILVDLNTKSKQECESARKFYASITSIVISYQERLCVCRNFHFYNISIVHSHIIPLSIIFS